MNSHTVILAHGSGGKRMDELIRNIFLDKFSEKDAGFLTDSFVFDQREHALAFTTDSFVVDPLFFPGGDIGKIAVSGTVNDLAVSGAVPMYLSSSFIIEEGFPVSDLKEIVRSMAEEAAKASIKIVTGDTKVVPKGKADKLFINTSGIGLLNPQFKGISSGKKVETGDLLIINGNIGDHSVAVMSKRDDISFEEPVFSDVAPLNELIQKVLNAFPDELTFMRDVTRGGLATVAKELIDHRNYGINLMEDQIPISGIVQSYCDIFGYDPLYLANEGKVIMVVKPSYAKDIVSLMKQHPQGQHTAIIGEIVNDHPGKVYMQTQYKGTRVVDKLSGEQLPRIC